jgi:hypothetical protein
MRNGVVVIITPHDFEHPSRWYYSVYEVKMCLLRVVTSGRVESLCRTVEWCMNDVVKRM